jgi:biotin transporter BioY
MREQSCRMTLMDIAFPRTGIIRDVALVVGFSILTALSAQLSFWVGPVPLTGQTFVVLLSGLLLGSRLGAMSQISYIAVGCTGLPFWFATGGAPGVARLLGPTGGYLIGFVAAAFLVGLLAERGWGRKMWTTGLAMLAGEVTLYVFGLSWLTHFLPQSAVLGMGLYPFIPGDVIKLVLAAMALPSAWSVLNRSR